MSNVKTLTTIAIAALCAAPAFAQDAQPDVSLEPAPEPVITDFTAADLDQDETLNADEFVSFAIMRAERGVEAFKDVVMGGEYSAAFTARDADASGGVDLSEMSADNDKNSDPDLVEPETLNPEPENTIDPDQ